MIKLSKNDPGRASTDMLVYFCMESPGEIPSLQSKAVQEAVQKPWDAGDFSGKAEEQYLFYPSGNKEDKKRCPKARRIMVAGMGKMKDDPNSLREQLRLTAGSVSGTARKLKANKISVVLPDFVELPPADVAECVTEGLLLGNYLFTKYKKNTPPEEKPVHVGSFTLYAGGLDEKQARKGMKMAQIAARAVIVARNMANEPGNGWTPSEFADFSRKLAKESGLSCTVLDKPALKRLGMGGILAVNQGSAIPPKLVILEYHAGKSYPTLLLVGKGLTFDSGGISLKPSAGMEEMKYDMCGGAAVLAAMQGIAQKKPSRLNIVAMIPATDNMSGSAALKPGDIITHYNGKTSEVVNTDAEGRLILADALAYGVEKYGPDAVIDLATLTGAVIIGLGHHRTGLLSNNDELAARIEKAGDQCGEPFWRLPLGPEYRKQLKSEVADLKNIGGKEAGTITAAEYLQEFIGEAAWAHLDIAGTAWNFTEKSYIPGKGPSGIGVRVLLKLIEGWKPLKK